MTLFIKKLIEDIKTPSYAHEGDVAMDLYAAEDKTIHPNERTLVRTGIAIAIPKGYAGLIWDKSGIATKNGLKTVGGVIDASYRGEILVSVIHLGDEPYDVKKNNKIAQMLIQKVEHFPIEIVDSLDETSRGTGGFGSTGLQ